MPNDSQVVIRNEAVQPLVFKSVKDLYDTPAEETSYCVEGMLPTSGLSILAGKPKAGKTTLARQLAVAVAQGESFLGRQTQQGTVLYLALEEKQSEVTAHFQQLGLTESDPVLVRCGSVPMKDGAVSALERALTEIPDIMLVILDPIFRFIGVRDGNDYVQVNNALEQVLDLARRYGVHILTVHHLKKKETEDISDATLGSTAIVAAADTFLALMVDGRGVRTLCTRQRYGRDMEPTILVWNEETRSFSLGETADKAEQQAANATRTRIEREMWAYVAAQPGCTQEAILNAVRGKVATKKSVLQAFLDQKAFVRSGAGVKGEPHLYQIAPIRNEAGQAVVPTGDICEV
jgi:AAA domain